MFAALRVAAWGLVVILSCFTPAMAQEGADPFGGPASSAAKRNMPDPTKVTPVAWAEDQDQRTSRIQQTLREPLDSVGIEVNQAPLHEVISLLRDNYDLQVQLDHAALVDLGLTPDMPIDAHLEDISLGAALRLLLNPHGLAYVVTDEVLLITSEEEALTRLVVAVYPVGDILAVKEGYESAVEENDGKTKKRGVEDMDGLINVIISTVAPDSWLENGGGEADIRPLQPGLLIISQTADVHERIQHLLAALRQAKQHACAVPHRASPEVTGFHGGMNGPMPQVGEAPREAVPSQQDQGGGGMF